MAVLTHLKPLLFLTLCILFSQSAFAKPPENALALRNEFIRLKNLEDSSDGLRLENKVKVRAWASLAERMKSLLSSNTSSENGIRNTLRYSLAELQAMLGRGLDDSEHYREAAESLSSLLSGRINDSLSNELRFKALILKGDFDRELGSVDDARRSYLAAIQSPGVTLEQIQLGRMRLLSLKGEESSDFVIAPEVERPQILELRRGRPSSVGGRERVRTIVIDPGHGGEDSGAIGVDNLRESEVTLRVARELKSELQRDKRIRVSFTRHEDEFVPLAKRTQWANHLNADLFLSLHVNASPSHTLSGFETYYLDNTDDQGSKKLAERENGVVSAAEVDDVSFILSDLIQSGKMTASIKLAHDIDESLKKTHPQIKSRGVLKAPFFVLVGAHMPCVLSEMLFVDHPSDGKLLASRQFQQKLAVSLAAAVRSFLKLSTSEKKTSRRSS